MFLYFSKELKLQPYQGNIDFVVIFQYGTATGTCGTISWQVEGLKLRLIGRMMQPHPILNLFKDTTCHM